MAGFRDGLAVLDKNSHDNYSVSDAVGNRLDTSFSGGIYNNNPSLVGHAKAGYYHIHSPAKVYPTLDDAVTVTASATGWTLGTKVVIVPADTITEYFDIHWVLVHAISATDEYDSKHRRQGCIPRPNTHQLLEREQLLVLD